MNNAYDDHEPGSLPTQDADGKDNYGDASKKMLYRSNDNLGLERALGGHLKTGSVENVRDNVTFKKDSVANLEAEKEQLRTKIFELEAALKDRKKKSTLCNVL